jgi:peptidoglycan-N-acetylglucosamine deacetylase
MAVAFLTVDDGPSALFEEKLDFLSERAVPAVFFCVGREIAGREDQLLRALELGFELGNHSWSHPRFSGLSAGDCSSEIERADDAIGELYGRAGLAWKVKRFRFPFFDPGKPELMEAIQERLRELGYEAPAAQPVAGAGETPGERRVDTLCGFDQMEYLLGNPQAPAGLCRAEAILARIGGDGPRDGDIVLIHDHDYTHSLFFECVESYLRHGIAFAELR